MLQSVLIQALSTSNGILSLRDLIGLACVALGLALLFQVLYKSTPTSEGKKLHPPELELPTITTTRSFFEKRFEFIRDGFKATSSAIYQIPLLGRKAIVLSGEEGRELFTREKGLNIYDSFSMLLGGGDSEVSLQAVHAIIKDIILLQRPENLQSMIPMVVSTCERFRDSWGSQTVLDPCSSIHEVTFEAIMTTTFYDISQDPALCSHLKSLVDIIDSPANTYFTWCPWLPNALFIQKVIFIVRFYWIVWRYINMRKASGGERNDAVQKMLEQGSSTPQIFAFILGLSLAGARATGTIVSWLIMRLSSNPEWSSSVQEEIQALLSHSSQAQSLSSIPLQAWESQTPILDLCIRETLRTSQPYTAVRRNNGPDLTLAGYQIPSGSLVIYPFADTSLNPEYYSEPMRWDPSREYPKGQIISWGAGKYGCKGQRLAMLSMKLVTVFILSQFEVKILGTDPVPDYNDSVTCRPQEECGILLVRK